MNEPTSKLFSNMKRIILLLVAINLIVINDSLSQDKSFKKLYIEAESYFLYGDYLNALPKYLELISIEPLNSNINYTIGVCYLKMPGKYDDAITYLERAATNVTPSYKEGSYKEKHAPEEAIFYLGKAYRLNGNLEKAIETLKKYRALLDVSEVYFIEYVDLQIQSCNNAFELMEHPVKVIKEKINGEINTKYEEFNPAINKYENMMIFSRMSKITDREVNEDIMVNYIFQTFKTESGWSKPKNISKKIYADEYGTSSYISDDGNHILINFDDFGIFNVYESNKVGSKWSEISKLHKNINSRSNDRSAMITSDGKTMYFISDRAGGFGVKDIYKSIKNAKGNWEIPVNLGPSINTQFDEETPFFLEENNTLYFSSEGHHSMGGYDVFSSTLQENGTWSEPLNLGYPVNTLDDDMGYYPINDEYAYMAMYTDETMSNKDIFKIKIQPLLDEEMIVEAEDKMDELNDDLAIVEKTDSIIAETETIEVAETVKDTLTTDIKVTTSRTGTVVYGIPEITLTGKINLQDNKEEYNGFNVNIINTSNNETVASVVPDNSGLFSYIVNPGNYRLVFSGNGYEENSTIVNIPVDYNRKTAEVNIDMVPIEVSSGEYFAIKSVFFDYNDFSLARNLQIELEKLSAIMTKNPSLYLEVTGHTDSKGSTEYNLALSKKRSRSVIEYIAAKGIDNERFVAKGVGEEDKIAINQNPDGTDNPEGRKYNRRVDIKILRSNNDNIVIYDVYVPEHLRLKKSLTYSILLVETNENLEAEYFNKYEDDAISNVWISPTSNGYVYSVGEYTKKSDAIPLLNKVVDIGFPHAKIINNLELKKLHDSGTPTAKAAKQKEKEILKTGTFTIQLMALKNPVELSYFSNVSNVKKHLGKDGYTRYTYGEYIGYYKAKEAIQEIVNKGYTDAFVVNVERYK